ncbi:MAG: hypothetical protein EA412_03680, partial [Chitinophagaceae bacterium]
MTKLHKGFKKFYLILAFFICSISVNAQITTPLVIGTCTFGPGDIPSELDSIVDIQPLTFDNFSQVDYIIAGRMDNGRPGAWEVNLSNCEIRGLRAGTELPNNSHSGLQYNRNWNWNVTGIAPDGSKIYLDAVNDGYQVTGGQCLATNAPDILAGTTVPISFSLDVSGNPFYGRVRFLGFNHECDFLSNPCSNGYIYGCEQDTTSACNLTVSLIGSTDNTCISDTIPPEGCFVDSVVSTNQGNTNTGGSVATIRSNPQSVVGPPGSQAAVTNGEFYSLGFGGDIIVRFSSPIANGPGNDLRILEVSGQVGQPSYPIGTPCSIYPEKAEIAVSQDGINFIILDTICRTGEVDIDPLPYIQYVRITDVSNPNDFGTGPLSDGYDLDAIECLNGLYDAENGSIQISVSGGQEPYTFLWSNGETTQNISGLSGGTYTVTVTDDDGCFETLTVFIDDLFNPVITDVDLSVFGCGYNISCYGASDGFIDITVSSGIPPYTFEWSGSGNFTSNNQNINNLQAGLYNVTITDANNCIYNESFELTEPNELFINIDSISVYSNGFNVSCFNSADGMIEVSLEGGCLPVSVSWSGPDGFVSDVLNIDNLVAGDYNLSIVDSNGCSLDTLITLTQPDSISLLLSSATDFNGFDISCNGESDGEILSTVSGGVPPYQYLWSNGSTTESIENLTAGLYSVTVTDSVGCIIESELELTEPAPLLVTIDSIFSPSCFIEPQPDGCFAQAVISFDQALNVQGGPVAASRSNPNAALGAPNGNFVSLGFGGEIIFDMGGQVQNGPGNDIFVTEITFGNQTCATYPEQIEAYASQDLVNWVFLGTGCLDAGFDLGTLPWARYFKFIDISDSAFFAGITGHVPDGYDIDAVECLNGIVYPDETGSAFITVSGGVPPYSYNWSNGTTSEDLINVVPGTYTLTITDANGCEETIDITIEETLNPVITSISSPILGCEHNISCFGGSDGSIFLEVDSGTPPYIYNWSGPNNFSENTQNLSGLSAGTYSVTVTDANGCIDTASITLTEPDELLISDI